jgi:hypothetical protein
MLYPLLISAPRLLSGRAAAGFCRRSETRVCGEVRRPPAVFRLLGGRLLLGIGFAK